MPQDGKSLAKWADTKALRLLPDLDAEFVVLARQYNLFELIDSELKTEILMQKFGELHLCEFFTMLKPEEINLPMIDYERLTLLVCHVQKTFQFKQILWNNNDLFKFFEGGLAFSVAIKNGDLFHLICVTLSLVCDDSPAYFTTRVGESGLLDHMVTIIKTVQFDFVEPTLKNILFYFIVNFFKSLCLDVEVIDKLCKLNILEACKVAIKRERFPVHENLRVIVYLFEIIIKDRFCIPESVGNCVKLCLCSMCSTRQRPDESFKKCLACGLVFYCSKKCQTEHWKCWHKSYCKTGLGTNDVSRPKVVAQGLLPTLSQQDVDEPVKVKTSKILKERKGKIPEKKERKRKISHKKQKNKNENANPEHNKAAINDSSSSNVHSSSSNVHGTSSKKIIKENKQLPNEEDDNFSVEIKLENKGENCAPYFTRPGMDKKMHKLQMKWFKLMEESDSE